MCFTHFSSVSIVDFEHINYFLGAIPQNTLKEEKATERMSRDKRSDPTLEVLYGTSRLKGRN